MARAAHRRRRSRSGNGGWRPGRIVGATILLVAAVALVVTAIEVSADGRRAAPREAPRASGGTTPATRHTVSGTIDGSGTGEFELVGNATAMTVRSADLDGAAYRVSTDESSPVTPRATVEGGRVSARLVRQDGDGPAEVEVRLDRGVLWTVRLTGGGSLQTVDLSGGRCAGVELRSGATTVELTLPRPAGTVDVRALGGYAQVVLHLPPGVPARVAIGGGAGTVVVDGATRSGVGGGTVITPPGWDSAADRYDVQVAGGVSTLAVDRR